MHAGAEEVTERPGDLTASRLTAATGTGPVPEFTAERIGTGQLRECHRARLTYADGTAGPDGPESVVLKVARDRSAESPDRAGAGSART